ncbi:hemolysin D [Segetibacter sp. 3557_3]|uniref:PAQR family membrane homeostasis protein TrhA n=1 Tax=Segetibacter sp. 3557_3 TaxID=2547429 RepID=UPI00105859BB|nr:hemolysin III family protein [Segetibacter sp. 3557_3]TDH26873.1 hemolysin D [Segetibacter sp. 3557_3]
MEQHIQEAAMLEADFSREQEVVNTSIHAVGILFGMIAIPILLRNAAENTFSLSLLSVIIYGFCFLMTFTFSTLYHGLQRRRIKRFFKLMDRISIYFFIAGTYTPFVLHYMYDQTGVILLSCIWVLVIFGVLFELFLAKRYFILSVIFYLIMGWLFIVVSKSFFAAMPTAVIVLILSGVFLYSLGVVFYVWQKWKYHHAIWHTFVLFASICHYVAVLKAVS